MNENSVRQQCKRPHQLEKDLTKRNKNRKIRTIRQSQ